MPSSSERPGTLDAFQTSLSPLCVWVCGVCECECVCVWCVSMVLVWVCGECVVCVCVWVCVCARVKSVKLYQYCRQYNTFQLTFPLVNKPQHTHFLLCRNLAHCLSMSNFNASIHPNAWGGGRYSTWPTLNRYTGQFLHCVSCYDNSIVLYSFATTSDLKWSSYPVSQFFISILGNYPPVKQTELCGLRHCSCSSPLL